MLLRKVSPRLVRGVLRALVLLLASVVWAVPLSHAQPDDRASQVVLRASELVRADPEFQETLRELLSRVGLELVSPSRADDERVLWRVDVETSERSATVTMYKARSDTRVRRQVDRAQTKALFRETLSHVILGVIEPHAGDDEPVEAKVEQKPAPEAPAPKEPVREQTSVLPAQLSSPRIDSVESTQMSPAKAPSFSVFLRGGPLLLAVDYLVAQFGGGATLRFKSALSPALGLEALGIWPAAVGGGGLDAKVRMISLRLLPSLRLVARPRGALDLALAPGLDLVSFSTERAPREVAEAPRTKRIQPVAGARLTGSLRLSRLMVLLLGAGLDVDFAPRRWVVADRDGSTTLFETSRYRPYAYLGLDLTLFARQSGEP
jgi:hypothetical protein